MIYPIANRNRIVPSATRPVSPSSADSQVGTGDHFQHINAEFSERRKGDRRKSNRAFIGSDRRKNNYDRRKLRAKAKVRPAMSDYGSEGGGSNKAAQNNRTKRVGHDAGYVARYVADHANTRRASMAEARKAYAPQNKSKIDGLLRGLCIDEDIN